MSSLFVFAPPHRSGGPLKGRSGRVEHPKDESRSRPEQDDWARAGIRTRLIGFPLDEKAEEGWMMEDETGRPVAVKAASVGPEIAGSEGAEKPGERSGWQRREMRSGP